jgi:hypothetical protein
MYVTVPQEVIDMKMPATEKLVLAYVLTYRDNGAEFDLTNAEIGKFIGVGKRQACSVVASLIDKGILKSELCYKSNSKQVESRVLNIAPGIDISFTTVEENCEENISKLENTVGSLDTTLDKSLDNTQVNTTRKKPSKKLLGVEQMKAFTTWYDLYDLKVGRKKAEKAWSNISPDLYETIIDHTREFIKTNHKDDTFPSRPHPSTYLNDERWEDEIVNTDSSEDFLKEMQEKYSE